MKKLIFVSMITFVAFSCNQKSEKAEDTKTVSTAPMALSMTPTYSSSFQMGNPDYAAMIVKGSWKDWQDNTMDNMQKWAADSIVALHSNATITRGVDSLMASWKKSRAEYSAVTDSIDAVIPVYSTDKKENWVLIWVVDYSTDKKGVKDTTAVMETWRINKDGKADLLMQFDRHSRKN